MLLKHNSPRRIPYIKEQRNTALNNFEYMGNTFQCDPTSLTLISGRALKITRQQLNNEPVENQVWRTTDNLFVTFTPNEFLEFAEKADAYVEQVYSQSWQQIDGESNV